MNGKQILCRIELTRCMRGIGKRQIFLVHAAPVVRHADPLFPALFNFNRDLRRPCVNGILNKLLDNGVRSVDHFSCGDLIIDAGRQNVDLH